jgi:putative ABC transport system permease protein
MLLLRLAIRNTFRHRLRTLLTVLGVAIAITAFGLLRTLVGLWTLGVEASSAYRLVTRNAISLVFSLPVSYKDRIRQVPGVTSVSWGNWFGGVYVTEKNFFPNFAVEPESYLALYPEFVLSDGERSAFIHDRKGAVVGRKLADRFGWKLGDSLTLRGTIFPGNWEFVIRGVYRGAQRTTDETQMFFHWQYLNETMRRTLPRRADQVGFYMIGVADPHHAPETAQAIDQGFRNSLAETLTETEKAFQLGFASMTEAIMKAIEVVSYVVIIIIMVVMVNTMAMTVRERIPEYATMKAMGFGPRHVGGIVFAESLFLALCGSLLGIAATFPAAHWIERELSQFFPLFDIDPVTIGLELVAGLLVGLVAGIFPVWRALTLSVADGLRRVG